MKYILKTLLVLPLILLLNFSRLAQASLGNNESSIDKDSQYLKSSHQKSQVTGQTYTVHELKSSTLTVREYLSSAGVVFAVTWRGVGRPDLSALMGSYYTEYKDASDKQRRGAGARRMATIKSSGVIVSEGGHMRDNHGKAVAIALVPAGVKVETLQ
jgi:hypothetical protein